jgi:cytochrome P450
MLKSRLVPSKGGLMRKHHYEQRQAADPPPAVEFGDLDDPYPYLAAARRNGSVSREWPLPFDTGAPMLEPTFSVLAYDKAVRVLRDHETYSSLGLSGFMGPLFADTIIAMDEPEHHVNRALVAPAFRPKVLERWRHTLVRQVIDEIIDSFISEDRVDLVQRLTFAFPVRVVARILGLPEGDAPLFQRWSIDLINIFVDWDRAIASLHELRSYFTELIAERRAAPSDDIISDLIKCEVDGRRLDDEAIFAYVRLLLPAGVETTYRSLGNLLVGLLTHREQFEALRKDRALIGAAIEEGLRWQTPFLMVARRTTSDTGLGGVDIPADHAVHVFVASANRDERRYVDPDRFDVRRSPAPHVSFGSGPHMCLGMHLTRVETSVALEAILDRLPNVRLDAEAPAPRIRGTVLRSPDAVRVCLGRCEHVGRSARSTLLVPAPLTQHPHRRRRPGRAIPRCADVGPHRTARALDRPRHNLGSYPPTISRSAYVVNAAHASAWTCR